MKLTITFITTLFLLCSFSSLRAQVVFAFNEFTICEGHSFDLLGFQNDNVSVAVGWEIVGWRNISSTTVSPTTTTVYTLEYRQIANPSNVFTRTLTIDVRQRPTVSISRSGTDIVCLNSSVEILRVSAANYDTIYWLHIETGDRFYTHNLTVTATEPRATYALVATNEHCPVLARAEVEVLTVDPNFDPIFSGWDLVFRDSRTTVFYCIDPVNVSNLAELTWVPLHVGPDASSNVIFHEMPNAENDLYRVTDYRVVWDNPDNYTQGIALFFGGNYTNAFTIEVDILNKICGTTITHTRRRTIELFEDIAPRMNAWCGFFGAIGYFDIVNTACFPGVNFNVEFTNQTTPGEYIPTRTADARWEVVFDGDAPETLTYDITITYTDLNGTPQTLNFQLTVGTCLIIEYFGGTNNAEIDRSWLSGMWCSPISDRTCRNSRNQPATVVEITICQGENAYLGLWTNMGQPLEVVWDNPELPVVWNPAVNAPLASSNFQYDPSTRTYTISHPERENNAYFRVSPQETTIYTGTLFGVEFAFKVNVIDNRLAVDTVICFGESIDLRTLERVENIAGTAQWQVSNAIVSPLVDTEYLIFGRRQYMCPGQTEIFATEIVHVRVEMPAWMTTPTEPVDATLNCRLSLTDFLNTNVSRDRITWWYDLNLNPISDSITITPGITNYYAEIRSACGIDTVEIEIHGVPAVILIEELAIYSYELPFDWHDTTFLPGTQSGTVVFNRQTMQGCDSIVHLYLTVTPVLVAELNPIPVMICRDDADFNLSYVVSSDSPHYQSVHFDEKARAAGFNDIIREPVNAFSIDIPLPVGVRPDTYRGTLILERDLYRDMVLDFEVSIRYNSSVIIQMWNNVLALSNSIPIEEGCRLSSFQWHRNDLPIPGATGSYFYAGTLQTLDINAEYKVSFIRCAESVAVYTCPIIPVWRPIGAEFPTVVNASQIFDISMPTAGYVEIHDLTGRRISRRAVVEGANNIAAPNFAGAYVLTIWSKTGENMVRERIIVR
ncbi:MAG: hypothetical protein FWC94_05350 [Bacteroidales bacterium]|nr:hypothetical protein [Bacteroidales bacterium]